MRQQNRRRNPDMEAYRSWQSDCSDRQALQRYLLSMDRGREILDDPEQIVILDELIGQDEALRPIYARVRPDYSNEATPFREERWRTLADHYAGRKLDPRAALILVEMGLRSGVSIGGVYRILRKRQIIDEKAYEYINCIIDNDSYDNPLNCVLKLGAMGELSAFSVPALIHYIVRNRNIYWSYNVRYYCSWALGKIGPLAVSAVPHLIDSIENDDDDDDYVRNAYRTAIERITGERPS